MRTELAPVLALAAASLTLACLKPAIQVPAADQLRARREVAGQQRYLRAALSAGPLWDDANKVFLTYLPASEIDLVETPLGKPIPPPAFERVLPPGTPVRLQDLEFPGTFVIAQRVLVSPRVNPWVYVQVEGDQKTYIIVLPQEVKSLEDVRAELERYVTQEDVRPAFASLPYETREAILRKEATVGMSSRALEMAWGVPERKRVDRPAGTEEWLWASGKRRAYLRDDVVEAVEK